MGIYRHASGRTGNIQHKTKKKQKQDGAGKNSIAKGADGLT